MRPALAPILTAACALAAAPSASGAVATPPQTGFLTAPTDQIAVPGLPAGAEITPEGDLYTGWAEYELRFGGRLRAWDQPTRTVPDPALPVLSASLSDGAVRYTQTIFAIALAGQPVAYLTVSARNDSLRAEWARVELGLAYTRGRQITGIHGIKTGAFRYERPATAAYPGAYEQPGQPFSSAFAYSRSGRDLVRSGLLLARGPDATGRALAAGRTDALTAVHDEVLFSRRLGARGQVSWTWQIPLEPPPASARLDRALDETPPPRARAELARYWSEQEARMMRIGVPEPRVDAAFSAAITEMLCSRYETPSGFAQAPNRLQYRAFWIRDSAIETQALDAIGLHVQAEQNLAYLDTFQRPDGLFISQQGQYDGLGEALWALDEHALLTRDSAYAAAQLGRIGAAVGWLSAATALDPLGLLPPSNPADDELAYGHITGDDVWAAAGLRSAVNDAKLAGRADLAAAWRALDERFEGSLRRAISLALARTGRVPGALDEPRAQDWGNYDLAFPVEVMSPRSEAVRATVAWARAHMAEGLATYSSRGWLHDYLGFSVYETELAGGDAPDAVAGLYAELAHTTATDNGWETDIAPYRERPSATNLSPHGTFAADYVMLLRNMLVAERGGGIDLLAGASPAWLGPGQSISVTGAPTAHGLLSFTERSAPGRETLSWKGALTVGVRLRWVLPYWIRHARTAGGQTVGSTIELHGRVGSLTLLLEGRRPTQSYATAVAALDASYRARGLPPPLASSRD